MTGCSLGCEPSLSIKPGNEAVLEEITALSEMDHGKDIAGSREEEDEAQAEYRGPSYMLPSLDDVENIELYQEGGYHPVRIGDQIAEYTIIHKLGYGGYGTVWLARDTSKQRYVALKIIISNESEEAMDKDLKILKHLSQHTSLPGGNFVDLPINDFWITGPNGRHLCIVSKVAGPSIAHLTRTFEKTLEPEEARRMALQITQCLGFLHSEKVGVAHGDLTTSNVLLELGGFDSLRQDQVLEILGEPIGEIVKPYHGKKLGSGAPEIIYQAANMMKLNKLFTGNIVIIDFGEAFFLDTPPEHAGIPAQFCSPELEFLNQNGMPADVWALACTIFEMRTSEPLFESTPEDMVRRLGYFPKEFLEVKKEYTWLKDMERNGKELREVVGDISGISEEEKSAFYDLLRHVLTYDIGERLTVEEMLRHQWFSFSMQSGMEVTPAAVKDSLLALLQKEYKP